ncbi:MAG: T9SS type A sorting domain-containing protein [Candidatus Electryonea clarkiae]|nr:T9SS type A sorting domain-containing protein [Candidatus Electryonea clarkiae]MDP8286656.1 T9SS type A sorting domain-containing protein [Candidatus Electryonea clarkiae]
MRHLTFIILCIAIASIPVSAQPPDTLWTRTFGGGGNDRGKSVQQANDGGFIIVGETHSFGAGSADVWLIKTDSTGHEEWNHTFGGVDWDAGQSLQQTNDNGFIIAGVIGTYNGFSGGDVWLIKTDSNGNEEWDQTFEGIDSDCGYSVQQTNDGGYIIAGQTSFQEERCLWLIKTDSTGNEEWNRIFDGNALAGGFSVQQTNEGGYIIVGETWSYDGMYIYMIKTDSDGEEEWSQTFFDGQGFSIQQTNDRGYIVAGLTMPYSEGEQNVWLIKTDSTGTEEWNNTFGGESYDIGRYVRQTSDGGFIITGLTDSFGAGERDVWLIKTDSTGNEEWNRTFGGTEVDIGCSVQQTHDGGYIITGYTFSFGAGSYDVWLIRLAAEDNEIIESTTSNPTDYDLEEVFPNPFNSMTTISVGLPISSELKLSVYNITGQEVAVLANERYAVGYHQLTFNANELPSGIYFIRASVPDKMDQVRKIVLVR